MADAPTVLVDTDGPVATVRLNRPDSRNGIVPQLMTELYAALSGIATDSSVRVVVLRGEGADFCPGADIKHYAGDDEGERRTDPNEFKVAVLLHEMPQVTIAAVTGACAGAGFGWACACDLRIASETSRFNTAFLDVGVAGDMGGPWTLPRLVGAAKARELYFLPGKFDAVEAMRIGLLSQVSSADSFESDLKALVARLAAAAPLAITAMKQNFVAAEQVSFEQFIGLESEKHRKIFGSEDTSEAFRAFVEKRPPVFRGK